MSTQLTIFYDAACSLCNFEMEMYRKKDKNGRLHLVDISSPQFEAADWGLDPELVMVELCTIDSNGVHRQGVESFVAIWETLEVNRLMVFIAGVGPMRWVLDRGYRVFTKVRPYLPKRETCSDGRCNTRFNKTDVNSAKTNEI